MLFFLFAEKNKNGVFNFRKNVKKSFEEKMAKIVVLKVN